MEEMGRRFAGSLVLSEREAKGLRIGGRAVQAATRVWFALVCKVVTQRSFRRRSFIDLFSRLWGGERGVSISDVEDDRFLVRFSCEEDLVRVLDKEPWDFDRSLIVMGRLKESESVMDVELSTALFWVQAHGVPFRYRIPEVAMDIGGLLGEFKDVTSASDGNCFGRFLRIRVRLDVSLALLRRTVVDFQEKGEQLIEFKYERLPEFCQECGVIGHPTRICDEKLGIKGKLDSDRPFLLTLRAETDLYGNRLGSRVGRGRSEASLSGDGSEGGSGSQSWVRNAGGSGLERSGRQVVPHGLLQLEGPTQDTASSPVKVGSQKDPVEEERDRAAVIASSDAGVGGSVLQSAEKMVVDRPSEGFKNKDVVRLGEVMRATFGSSSLVERQDSASFSAGQVKATGLDVKVVKTDPIMLFSVVVTKLVMTRFEWAHEKWLR
ncbi:hypothetical protein M0R45_001160 [Rubus argutus]|uniref:DUF4283 domain-containing protein n=1 Tax=Rubus argutus TaxID=59490 RepID=A0AAW1VME8_RUBAR